MRSTVAFTIMTLAGLAVIPLLLIVSITGAMAQFSAWLVEEPKEV
jgi:uncharacterized iron-regulated membrane protein